MGLAVTTAILMGGLAIMGCSDDSAQARPRASSVPETETRAIEELSIDDSDQARTARESFLDREFALHGLVTGLQLAVRADPEPEGRIIGWLRIGGRIRLKTESRRSSTCASGWYALYPRGWACAGLGIEVGGQPPESELAVAPPSRDAALPYEYWYVKDSATPEFHRLPSRDEQRAAVTFSARYVELLATDERRAARFLAGELPTEPTSPTVVNRYLDRGFFLASAGVDVRASRRFVRTVRGRFAKQSQLIARTGSDFHGVELDDDRQLPVAWMTRSARPRIKREREDGIHFLEDNESEPIERHTVLESWQERRNIGGTVVHVLEGDRYFLDWYVAVARAIERPREITADEPWVHVNLDQQTLVVYRGDQPVYATLVSTGLDGFETPTGTFAIRRKYIADTMANVGAGLDDRYSIEDVPWTQYFEGSFALHGAFWHERFGLRRSHGCVNLSPPDAHRVFDDLRPHVPEGWLGVSADRSGFETSHVVVTAR